MFNKLMTAIGLHWVGGRIAAAAKGELGPGPQKAYLFLQGHKTQDGVLLALITAGLLSVGQVGAAVILAAVASLLVVSGLVDSAWRSAPTSWAGKAWYRFLRDHWGWVVSGSAFLINRYSACDPGVASQLARLHLSCGAALTSVTVTTAILGWAIGAAKLADAPKGDGIVLQVLQGPEAEA